MEERGSVKMNTLSHQCISSTATARELTRFQVLAKLMLRSSLSHSVPLASPSRLSSRRCCPSDPPIVASKSSLRRRCPGALHVKVVAEPPPLRRAPACRRGVLFDEVIHNKLPPPVAAPELTPTEGPQTATRGGVNGSQSKFLTEFGLCPQINPRPLSSNPIKTG
jgi:hypothetical protein